MASLLTSIIVVGLAASCQSFVVPQQGYIGLRLASSSNSKCSTSALPRHHNNCMVTMDASNHIDRRAFIGVGATLILSAPYQQAASVINTAPTSSPIVVEGQMRLEVGSDKKLQAYNGRGNATVYLRCVGRGIISKTSLEIDVADFPPPGQPKPGESGGVPFFVTEANLNAKTEKGNVVNKEMWGEDDIFVRVDVDGTKDGKTKRILTGIGKAKLVTGPDGKSYHQKPLVLLE